ncbi:hypothetical protein J1N35_004144 [Gossypium stocksii]|uniref:CCHC-type domain-containing protein n=1 Tax=Gossypium stocksii TaxID=47602 RepID=A0A9D3WB08_9ROSI|nr:hypothetical protein J1N35_004144 [Gossypium stocksii]
MIGKVKKLDFNRDSRARGQYARMVVFVNLGRPLVSKILISGSPQRIEYDNLPVVCFKCGCYGHTKETCSSVIQTLGVKEKGETSEQTSVITAVAGGGDYSPWMLVERKTRHGNSVSCFPFILNSQNAVDVDQVKVDPHISLQKRAEHVVHFNPTFEENSFVNVEVKEGLLEAKNHLAVVFKNRNILEHVSKEIGGTGPSTGIKFPKEVFKEQNAKVIGPKGGWKLNKTLKGPDNRFKNSKNIRVPSADSMKREVELFAFEINGKSAMDLSRQKGE